MGGQEQKFVNEAFETNWIAPLGPNVNGFEEDLREYVGTKAAGAFTSGTASIHLALILLGVKAGDEVLCQSFTFSATANPIRYVGAIPVFIDSEPNTWNMDPDLLEQAILDRGGDMNDGRGTPPGPPLERGGDSLSLNNKLPKAIIAVHLYGMPARMEEIRAIGEKYGIPVIEDAAESLGAHISGKKTGSFGKVGILSFNGNKIITTSGGGALISDDDELIQKARFLSTQARDDAPHYQHSEIGYNYRMSNIVAGIGRGQMMVLENRINQRRANFKRYKDYFSKWNDSGFNIEFQEEPVGYFSNRWLTAIVVDPAKNHGLTREEIRLKLQEENIESRPLWKPMHLQPVFEGFPYYGSGVSDQLFEHGLCLPSGSNLTENDFERIFRALDHIFKNCI